MTTLTRRLLPVLGPVAALALALSCVKEPAVATPPDSGSASPRAEPDPGGPNADDEPDNADLPAAEVVLERAVEAIGGLANINAIESYYSEATMEVKGQNLRAAVKIWWQAGDFYMHSDMTGVGVSKVWKKGDAIFTEDPVQGRRQLEGKEAEQAALSASVSIAAHWRDFFKSAKTSGRRAADGKELLEVEFIGAHDSRMTMAFDADSGLPAGQSSVQETPMGDMPISTSFEDYREVGGIKTPFRSVTSMSLFQSVLTVEKFEVGAPIDPAKFSPTP